MSFNIKSEGTWKEVKQFHVKSEGTWKQVQEAYIKQNGVWSIFYRSRPPLEYRYFVELYGAEGGGGQPGGKGGYTSFNLYPDGGVGGNKINLRIGSAGNGTQPGSGWGSGGRGVGPSTTTGRSGGGGGGSSAVFTGSAMYAVCGGGGGGSGGDSGQGRGGNGASPDALSKDGDRGGSHDGDLGPGAPGGGGGTGGVGGADGGDSGCGISVRSPGAGGGGGGGLPRAGGSSPTDPVSTCNTTRCGGGGGGGGGLGTLDGQIEQYRMVFNSITRGSYSGRDGYAKISVFTREKGSTGPWYLATTYEYGPGDSQFDPSTIPDSAIAQPVITSPANGASLPNRTPTLQATAFAPIIPTTHRSSSWQISRNTAFTDIVWESLDNTSNLTSITVPAGAVQNGVFYCRVRYTGANGYSSNWSPTVNYTFPVVTPTIQFTQNIPTSYSATAGTNGNTFTVAVVDTSNTGTNFSYQWYFNGIAVSGATSSSWRIDPFYWSDNGKAIYCSVRAQNQTLNSTSNSQSCSLAITRSSQGVRTDVTNLDQTFGDTARDVAAGFGQWEFGKGFQFGNIPAGGGRVRFQTQGTILWFMRKANFPSGNGCTEGRGTDMTGALRMAIYDQTGNRLWSQHDRTFRMFYGNNDGTNNYDQPGQKQDQNFDDQIDLDPQNSYTLWVQAERGTVDKCDCPNYDNCQDIGYAGSQSFKQQGSIKWGFTPFGYKDDTRPTPTPPG